MGSIFGIDIIGGQIKRYALVSIGDFEFEKSVTKAKLFRLIRSKKPEIVALDNIFEVFSNKNEVVSFLKEMPADMKLVQVTSEGQSLLELAKRFGIRMNMRNPFDEAKACALLASFGVGYEVSAFTDKTKIVISRGRSLGKGGWRQKKYGRRVHDVVRQVYKEICFKLSSKGLEYVDSVRKGYGGISRAEIIVNASRREVPVHPFRTKDVQVKVEAVEKEKLEFIPLSKTLRYTIVGVDPGATTAVAVFDLNGNLVGVSSRKNWKVSEVIDYISSLGKPVVISTDKSSPPEMVQKLRAAFNAVIYVPKEDLSVEKKRLLASRYNFLNDHERDAIASALDAFNVYKSKFKNIEKRLPTGVDVDRIKAEVLKGSPLATLLQQEDVEKEKKEEKKEIVIPKTEIEKRDKIIAELKQENEALLKKIDTLKEEIEKLRERIVQMSKEEYEKIRRENYVRELEKRLAELRSEIKKKDEEILELRREIEELKNLKMLGLSGWREIKVLKKFTREEIENAKISEGEIVYIMDSSGGSKALAEYLCSKKIGAVICGKEMSHLASEVFEEAGVPRISAEKLEIIVFGNIGAVNSKSLEKAIEEATLELKNRKLSRIEKIFEEYKRRAV